MNTLVVGGAGFIGSNVAAARLKRGETVTVFDNLSRKGARENLLWLETLGASRLRVVLGDARRDARKLRSEVAGAGAIYHLAGQVAVTTSLIDPEGDLEANLGSTLVLLEAMRAVRSQAALVFASTNKVYGSLASASTILHDGRWDYSDGRPGVSEREPLDFHSPYGCSKGAADQYVRDFGRVYGLHTIVFRQSCIYGPRQFGVEDQGWLVHFILAHAFGRLVKIFGDGRQVRDALFIDDLIAAFDLAESRAGELAGEAFNIGGGRANSLSILELLDLLERHFGRRVETSFAPWREADQRVFISDNSRVEATLGWRAQVSVADGLKRTIGFVSEHLALFSETLERKPGVPR